MTLICKLLKGRKFSDAENVLKSVSAEENLRYPCPLLAATIENCCCLEPKVTAKLFNLMLKVYSGNNKFDQVLETFDRKKNNGIDIDEKTCTVHLLSLMRNDQMRLGLEFFDQMIQLGIEVSVYSLTVVVDGLCESEQIKRCREFMEEMVNKGIKTNIITYNIMINACAKR